MHRLHFLTQYLQHPTLVNVVTLLALAIVVLAACYLLTRVDVSVIVVVGLFLQLFSGNWSLMGIPLPLDRLVLAVALIVLVLKGPRWVSTRRLVIRPLHLALLTAAAWAIASGIIAGTIFGHLGFYSLLDRFGLVPFAMFTLAPLIFGSAKQRNTLLIGLVAIGLYLGADGVLEGLHVWRLVFPSYIANPNVGIQWGRARGPMLETTGYGFCILCGMVGSGDRAHIVALSVGAAGLLPDNRVRGRSAIFHPHPERLDRRLPRHHGRHAAGPQHPPHHRARCIGGYRGSGGHVGSFAEYPF